LAEHQKQKLLTLLVFLLPLLAIETAGFSFCRACLLQAGLPNKDHSILLHFFVSLLGLGLEQKRP
jgi:hypothetical protein